MVEEEAVRLPGGACSASPSLTAHSPAPQGATPSRLLRALSRYDCAEGPNSMYQVKFY